MKKPIIAILPDLEKQEKAIPEYFLEIFNEKLTFDNYKKLSSISDEAKVATLNYFALGGFSYAINYLITNCGYKLYYPEMKREQLAYRFFIEHNITIPLRTILSTESPRTAGEDNTLLEAFYSGLRLHQPFYGTREFIDYFNRNNLTFHEFNGERIVDFLVRKSKENWQESYLPDYVVKSTCSLLEIEPEFLADSVEIRCFKRADKVMFERDMKQNLLEQSLHQEKSEARQTKIKNLQSFYKKKLKEFLNKYEEFQNIDEQFYQDFDPEYFETPNPENVWALPEFFDDKERQNKKVAYTQQIGNAIKFKLKSANFKEDFEKDFKEAGFKTLSDNILGKNAEIARPKRDTTVAEMMFEPFQNLFAAPIVAMNKIDEVMEDNTRAEERENMRAGELKIIKKSIKPPSLILEPTTSKRQLPEKNKEKFD